MQKIKGVLLLGSGLALTAGALADGPKARPTEKPLLWLVEGDEPSYLFGTIHLPDERVTTLPAVVEQALSGSDRFFAEIRLDPAAMMGSMTRMFLDDGRTLSDVLPADVYRRVARYVEKHKFDMAMFENMRIWALSMQLVLLDYMGKAPSQPLDMQLYAKASADGKEVGGIETLEEQLGVFDAFNEQEQTKLLIWTLEMLEDSAAGGYVEKLIKLYLAGDVEALVQELNESIPQSDPVGKKLIAKLITERDKRMAERMAKLLREDRDKSNFFAVGAGHLSEKTGVIALLRKDGFKIRRLTPADAGKLTPVSSGAKP